MSLLAEKGGDEVADRYRAGHDGVGHRHAQLSLQIDGQLDFREGVVPEVGGETIRIRHRPPFLAGVFPDDRPYKRRVNGHRLHQPECDDRQIGGQEHVELDANGATLV